MSKQPVRVQLRRTKGWRKPENTVVVARNTRWGNPFKVGDKGVPDAETAVRLFAESLFPYRHHGEPVHGDKLLDYEISTSNWDDIQSELRGKNLACWCPLDQPCHADVLLEIANKP